jgi:hypothetical protein
MSVRHTEVASLAGSKVLDTLPSGKVLAVVSKAAYLLGNNGELLWIAGEGTPMHQRCVHVSLDLATLEAGIEYWTEDQQLSVGNAMAIDLAQTPRWQAPTLGPGAPMEVVTACFRRVLAAVQSFLPDRGLAQAMPLIATTADGQVRPAFDVPTPLLERAGDPIRAITVACVRCDLGGIAVHSRSLIGLGPGLTPSGDDFVGGLLFAVHCLSAAYPERFRWGGQSINTLIDWACTRTNLISAAILRDMAGGQGPEPLHRVLIALLNDGEPHRVLVAINRLIRIGHSSGWDMLAGALTGMLMVAS